MANEYYERLSEMNPGDLADGLAMEAEFDAISQGFSKLPTPHLDGRGFEDPVRVGSAVNADEAVNKGQFDKAIGKAQQLSVSTYGNMSATAWGTLAGGHYLLFGTGAQIANSPATLVAGATYYVMVRHVIGDSGVSLYFDEVSIYSVDDATNADIGRVMVRIGSGLAKAIAGGWRKVALKKGALSPLEALTPAADRLVYYTGAGSAALAVFTPFARSFLGGADAVAALATLGAAADSHTHAIADVTNLQSALDAAELPLPDVWLPLNDSLKLLGGNGREVLVGSDVVARYADFTRASTAWYFDKSGVLRQAAINEPRFEPDGLLIEGKSTNLLRWDEVRTAAGAGVLTTVTSQKYPGITAKKVTGGNVTTALGASRENIKDSTVYTSTMIVDLANSNIPNGLFRFAFAYSAAWPGRYLTVDVNALTATPYDANTIGAVKRVGDLLIVTATTTSAAAASSSGGGSLDVYYLDSAGIPAVPPANGSMCIVGFQLEELGFASSFIPTTASAATRSPDLCSIPGTKNRTRFGEMTIAIECSVPDDGITRAIDNYIGGRAICLLDDSPDVQLYLRNRSGRYYHLEYGSDYKNTTSLEQWVRNFTFIGRISGPTEGTRTRTIGINGVLTASSSAYTHNPGVDGDKIYIGSAINSNHLFGCVRNIRIWQRALTDAQCKVIR